MKMYSEVTRTCRAKKVSQYNFSEALHVLHVHVSTWIKQNLHLSPATPLLFTHMNHLKQMSQTNRSFCSSEPLSVRLQLQTGRAEVDLAFVQTQPLPPHQTVAEDLLATTRCFCRVLVFVLS